jgi:hypothetical protein
MEVKDVVAVFGPQALALLGLDARWFVEDFINKCGKDWNDAPTLHPGGQWSHEPPYHRHTTVAGNKIHVLPHWTESRQKVLAVYLDKDWPALNRKQTAEEWCNWPQRKQE